MKLLERCERFFDFTFAAGIYDLNSMAGYRSGGPNIGYYAFGERIVRIDKDGYQGGCRPDSAGREGPSPIR